MRARCARLAHVRDPFGGAPPPSASRPVLPRGRRPRLTAVGQAKALGRWAGCGPFSGLWGGRRAFGHPRCHLNPKSGLQHGRRCRKVPSLIGQEKGLTREHLNARRHGRNHRIRPGQNQKPCGIQPKGSEIVLFLSYLAS